MGVKRSVMTSGMQPTILDIPYNCVNRAKHGKSCFLIFPLYFSEFPLYITMKCAQWFYIEILIHYSFSHLIPFKTPRSI